MKKPRRLSISSVDFTESDAEQVKAAALALLENEDDWNNYTLSEVQRIDENRRYKRSVASVETADLIESVVPRKKIASTSSNEETAKSVRTEINGWQLFMQNCQLREKSTSNRNDDFRAAINRFDNETLRSCWSILDRIDLNKVEKLMRLRSNNSLHATIVGFVQNISVERFERLGNEYEDQCVSCDGAREENNGR